MTDTPPPRLLQVNVAALGPTLWKWHISDSNVEVMLGYGTSRESAQKRGDEALFMLLAEG